MDGVGETFAIEKGTLWVGGHPMQRFRAGLGILLWLFVFGFHAEAFSIRIGEINPLTGKLAEHGTDIHEGILFAVEEINARGGIHGSPVELISRDDQSQPEVAVNQAEELLYRSRVVGLVGGYVDSLVGPISELAAKHRVPYVAAASLQRSLTLRRSNPFFFRVSQQKGIVQPLCDFILEQVRAGRVAVLYAATPGSSEFGEDVKGLLEKKGVQVPLFEKFRPGSPDFSSFLLKIRQHRPDVLVSGGFFPDHLVLIRQSREQQVPFRFYIGPWGIAHPSFIREMGSMSEDLLGMCAWNPGITLPGTEGESARFVEGFSRRFGKVPNSTTMHGYTSARALLAAMENAAKKGVSWTGEAISRELRSLDMLLPMERLAFDENGDPRYYQQVIVQIRNGQMVPVFPQDRAAAAVRFPRD